MNHPDGGDGEHPPFLFVVGCGRSGTTMFQAMLDSHPDLAIPGESNWVVSQALVQRRGFSPDQLLRALQVSPLVQLWGLDAQALSNAVLTAPSYAEAVRSVYRSYAELRGKQRYADKTPTYVLHLDLLASTFPEAKFIHLIRDGRNVALSIAQGPFGPNDLNRAILYWRHHVSQGRESGARLGSRYVEVFYEDLVAEPSAVLETVCRFVELDYSNQMLEYPAHVRSLLRRTLVPEAHPNVVREPVAKVRDWREELSRSEGEALERLGGDLLADLRYPLDYSAPINHRSARQTSKARVVRWRWWVDLRVTSLRARAYRVRARLRARFARQSV